MQFLKQDIEETDLLYAFSHGDRWDDSSCGIYTSPLLGIMANEKLIPLFIQEMVAHEQHGDYEVITQNRANDLLRQMAMFEMKWGERIKTQLYTSSEAKLATKLLMDFIGNRAEFFTNVSSIDHPHDSPGTAMSDDSEATYSCICFYAFNENYIIHIGQYW